MTLGGGARAARALPGPLRRAVLALLVFSVAEWASWVAVLVWAYDRGGVGAASLVSVVQLVPAVLVAPFASAIGDRMPRSRALAAGYALQGSLLLGTAALLEADAAVVPVAVGAALVTCAVTLTRPVHHAALPSLTRTPGELVAGNAASTTAEAVGCFLGPLASGLLIVRGGPEVVLALFGVLLLLAAAAVLGLAAGQARAGSGSGALHLALGGVRELREDPAAAVLVTVVAGQYVVVGALDILVIVLALDVLGTDSSGPGLLGSALGVGGIIGALGTVVLVGRRRLAPAVVGGLLLTGLPLALLPLVGVPLPVAVLLAVSGAGRSFVEVAGHTLLQRVVPDHVLARVFGVQEAVMTAATAVGAALAPLAVATLGRGGALVATGAVLPLAGAAAWGRLRGLDRVAALPGPHLSLLREVPTLRLAPLPVLEQLSRSATEVSLAPGDPAVLEGDPGDRFYVVRDGRLQVSRHGRDVRVLGAGDSFGEIALLRDSPRTATVRALDPTRLVAVHRADFLRAVGADPTGRSAAEQVAQSYLDEDSAVDDPAVEDPAVEDPAGESYAGEATTD